MGARDSGHGVSPSGGPAALSRLWLTRPSAQAVPGGGGAVRPREAKGMWKVIVQPLLSRVELRAVPRQPGWVVKGREAGAQEEPLPRKLACQAGGEVEAVPGG